MFEDCSNYTEGTTNYCATHGAYLRKLAKDITKPKKVHTLAKESKKMKEEHKTYSQLRKEHLLKHPECRVKLVGCTGKATQVHHISGRGKKLNREDTFMSCCHNCHFLLHNKLSAPERRQKGYLK